MTMEMIEKELHDRDAKIHDKLTGLGGTVSEINERLTCIEAAKGALPDGRRKAPEYNLGRVLKALADPKGRLDGFELEVHQEIKARMPEGAEGQYFVPLAAKALDAGATSPTAGGANLIQTTVLGGDVIAPLVESSLYMQLNPVQVSGGNGPIHLPKLTAGATGYVVSGDGEDITASDVTAGVVPLTPFYYAARVQAHKRVIDQSSPEVGRMILEDIQRQIGALVDQKAFIGSGSGEANGIYTAAGNSVTASSPQGVSYQQLVEMESALISDRVPRDGWVYVASPAAFVDMKTTVKVADGTCSDFLAEMGPNGWMANGFPLYVTSHLTGKKVVLYRTRSAAYGWWGAIGLDADPYGSNFASGSVTYRGFLPFDSNLLHAEAACTLN